MPKRSIAELLKRTLVIVAHPDDECIGVGGLLQRMEESAVVFCTDGGPKDAYFWRPYGSRENYAGLRRKEAEAAAEIVGLKRLVLLPITDQELYLNLQRAAHALQEICAEFQPDALLTLAYEGGHPDHDCCAFLGHVLAEQRRLPLWEMPLYHRTKDGGQKQQFVRTTGTEQQVRLSDAELELKRQMVSAYPSQGDLIHSFALECEYFRPQAQYDFLQPPAEIINYEVWQWPIKALDVCQAFAEFAPAKR